MMQASTSSIEGHPDLMEMRARYEEASETPQAQLLEGLIFLGGLYAAISPWVIHFNASATSLMMSNVITGIALAVLGLSFASNYSRTHTLAWVTPLLGAWLVVTPWVITGTPITMGLLLSNVITGGVLVLVGGGMVSLAAMKSRG